MKILFLSSGAQDPATRFRVKQFFPHFTAAGIRCTHRYAYGLGYNAVFDTPVGPAYKLACRLRRAGHTIGSAGYDAILLQRTAFNGTIWPERFAAARGRKLIFDFDDAVFLDARGASSPRNRAAFDEIVQMSSHVIAGNDYLARAAGAAHKTTVIPTVIDTDRYTPDGRQRTDEAVTIGWMGTAGNFAFFSEIQPAILQLLREFPGARFRIVANGVYRGLEGHPQVDQQAWVESRELDDLRSFDIGIMPLLDTDWTRGKCAFKLIQYMAVGRPVVASAVGANVELLDGRGAGFLARNTREWVEALRRLICDARLRRELGEAARARVVESYSVRSVLPTYLRLFDGVVAGRKREPRSVAV
jgi:glycosyltransferase involved in cell wall biosynthesis